MPRSTNKKRDAAAEALTKFKEASVERQRATVWIVPRNQADGTPQEVTEEVVSLLDMITTSMDWGSDFWNDDDLPAFITICNLLRVDTSEIT